MMICFKKEWATKNAVNEKVLEQITSFSYLGYIIRDGGSSETEIIKRIGIVKNIFNKMNIILASRERNTVLTMRIVTSCVQQWLSTS